MSDPKATSTPDPATSDGALGGAERKKTDVGSVFVSNYPPFSFWQESAVPAFDQALASPPRPDAKLGLYVHIPFCRRRCKFCYFKVFTDKNADQIGGYVDSVLAEAALYGPAPAISGRPVSFVYFGGGTPSYISVKHLQRLVEGLGEHFDLSSLDEFAFECEPGTLTRSKLEAIKSIGVTRLSLGIEHFDDEILQENGRAHVSKEIYRVLPWIREIGFRQLNVDLIAGMVGDRWETWKEAVEKTIEVDPDSVTIYQMELPFNTVYSQRILDGSEESPVADWATKRAWQDWAFERLSQAGYRVSSAYTMVKEDCREPFVYRDSLWQGADLASLGVSSFGHLSGVHYQNISSWKPYLDRVAEGKLPVGRAFETSERERLTRELILQLKRGHISRDPFLEKFGVDPLTAWAQQLQDLEKEELLSVSDGAIELTRKGLLRVDHFLPAFYDERYRNARYT